MAVRITYFVHGTTEDNLKKLASGHADVDLCDLGVRQSRELAKQRPDKFDAVFTSDLRRAVRSAELAFGGRCRIIRDRRLRECDYGDLTRKKKGWDKKDFIDTPYPRGESYREVGKRIADFLGFLKENYDGKHVAIVAHEAPQFSLDVLIKGKSWEQAIEEHWSKKAEWQPGWEYVLE